MSMKKFSDFLGTGAFKSSRGTGAGTDSFLERMTTLVALALKASPRETAILHQQRLKILKVVLGNMT